eukprot:SAG11_NODE_772_length_7254_cov_1.857582_3_plen_144_part_00
MCRALLSLRLGRWLGFAPKFFQVFVDERLGMRSDPLLVAKLQAVLDLGRPDRPHHPDQQLRPVAVRRRHSAVRSELAREGRSATGYVLMCSVEDGPRGARRTSSSSKLVPGRFKKKIDIQLGSRNPRQKKKPKTTASLTATDM